MFRLSAILALVLVGLAAPAAAQQRVVVTEGATVAVPARGAPRAARFSYAPAAAGGGGAVRPRYGRLAPREAEPGPAALLPAAAVMVPLAAAAALAAALSGGGGGGLSAPVRTR
ncbi:hypothetical protein [Roseicella frigidaeris]|uniref:Uncharacterized protein n=1 Tax=Roseicella frigidaeris TaxID=2230885 RepID=A0A327MBP5_9PROT|nr:hypothetical protein [Roseicella frigidaeris]RAI59886.1 hypothetical protein DOO78_06470 [Roseicella frigidaeris]